MILLDLNLPGMDGREVLAYIKADESLKTIPYVDAFMLNVIWEEVSRRADVAMKTG